MYFPTLKIYSFKGFIGRLHVHSDMLVIFIILFYYRVYVLLDAARIVYMSRWLSLSHNYEMFESQHMCAPRNYIGRSGTRTRYPRALSQPRYQ